MSNSRILSSVPDLATVSALFAVLPVIVKCKTFFFETENDEDLRSTISQERLDGLAFLAIENEAAKQHNTYDLLDSFANNKAR